MHSDSLHILKTDVSQQTMKRNFSLVLQSEDTFQPWIEEADLGETFWNKKFVAQQIGMRTPSAVEDHLKAHFEKTSS